MVMLRGEREEAEINHNSSILGTHIFSLELTHIFHQIYHAQAGHATELNWTLIYFPISLIFSLLTKFLKLIAGFQVRKKENILFKPKEHGNLI
jgi:hypothetical protein